MGKPLISEPMTVFTNLILAGLTAWFAWELRSWYWERLMNVHWHWSRAFWMLALGALLGAVSHGFGLQLSSGLKSAVWKTTTFALGLAAFFLLMGTLYHVFPFRTVQLLRWVPVLLLAGYLVIIWRDDRFINVVRFNAPALVFILLVMVYSWLYKDSAGSPWIILGILVSFAAAGVQISGFTLHRHFNHNDLYHVIQILGFYCLYKGGYLLKDYGAGR